MKKFAFFFGVAGSLLIVCFPALSFPESWGQPIAERLHQNYEHSSSLTPNNHLEGLVRQFYQARNYQPAWIMKEGWTAFSKNVLEALKHAEEEGLDPSDYQDGIDKMILADNAIDAAYEAEVALTRAMLRYIIDIKGGRLDPHTIDGEIYVKPEPTDASALLQEGITSADGQWIKTLCPPHPEYQALKTLLATYRALPSDHFGPAIVLNERKLKRGDSNAAVVILRQRLEKLALLSKNEDSKNPLFDASVENALKTFQAQHGLNADGALGPETLNLLNRTVEDYRNQIIVTMERWRWMPKELGLRHIRVNIARFELEAVANGQTHLRTPIVVGLRYRETPQFTAPMTEIIFNPAWHVPHKIALQEKLPLIRKNPSYLQRNNYVLYDTRGGDLERIDPEEIDWSTVAQGAFPYRLEQLPGSKNALGKIRFTIVNPFDIYLHSTPQQSLFEKPSRAYSHGCIRVKDYVALAEFALNTPQKWDRRTIESLLEDTTTRHIPLPQPLPVHIAYFTVGFNEKLEPYFMNDVYGQDARIWKALAERRQQRLLIAKATMVEG